MAECELPGDFPDGLYAVVRETWVAGFIVRNGRVRPADCAPILRRKLKSWATFARRVT